MSRYGGIHASVDAGNPRARAVCDRCSFVYNHHQLRWQFQYAGPQLKNLRILVCESCYDLPNEQLRTIILPSDPVPISDPRPEQYISDNNPISGIGQNPLPYLTGTNIGTLSQGGGTWAAFDGNPYKPFRVSAYIGTSGSSYGNWVGKNWAADPAGYSTPDGLTESTLSYSVSGFTVNAPNNSAFLGSSYTTTYRFQGSSDASTWTTLYSSVTDGTQAQEITVTGLGGQSYQYHRIDFVGDATRAVSVAQLEISVSNSGSNA